MYLLLLLLVQTGCEERLFGVDFDEAGSVCGWIQEPLTACGNGAFEQFPRESLKD
jgi:hypothetical protein